MSNSASIPVRVVVLLTSVALALLLLLAGAVVARAADDPVTARVTPHVEHTVLPGDTLWDIATVYTEPGDDVRDTVFDIRTANDLDTSVIEVGQVLVIPLHF